MRISIIIFALTAVVASISAARAAKSPPKEINEPRLNLFHYLFLDSTLVGVEAYLSIKSVLKRAAPAKIFFWHDDFLPAGDFWKALKPLVELKSFTSFSKRVKHENLEYLKLLILARFGGYFLGPNVIMIYFDPLLLVKHDFVMETAHNQQNTMYCNRVFASNAKSVALSRYLESYKSLGNESFSPFAFEASGAYVFKRGEKLCWPETLADFEALLSNRFSGSDLFKRMFVSLPAGNLFSDSIEFSSINSVSNPLFCYLRQYTWLDYDPRDDKSCQPAERLNYVHPDGTGIYSFLMC